MELDGIITRPESFSSQNLKSTVRNVRQKFLSEPYFSSPTNTLILNIQRDENRHILLKILVFKQNGKHFFSIQRPRHDMDDIPLGVSITQQKSKIYIERQIQRTYDLTGS